MDLYTIVIIVAILVAFGIGLLIDVDEFAGGVFSKLKGTKDKKEDK